MEQERFKTSHRRGVMEESVCSGRKFHVRLTREHIHNKWTYEWKVVPQ